ncbi:M16 family metallopeptidase [Sphingobium boeckii]|uniref:Zinc protease n=1 Tax=Sphingobium boeckii TaxID=1082345 RepID=A0A7W9EDL8_9SPHN|nr:insulinase family protein [Sphingobium boeckii]MBB5685428.1 zinc protease [Sphingobium boeckii]
MTVMRILLACAASALALSAANAKTSPPPSMIAAEQLVPADPAIHYGTLPNGMRYAILRNTTPQQSASIRLRIDMGSTAEADDQQGLAHFLEHMAFNGSKGVPEGEMVKILERYGLAFGADTNASTDFTQTVYKLDLPETNDAIIDTGLMLMREIASELSIAPDAVNRERGIILSERRARDQFGLRQLVDQIRFALPGTPVAKRLPIGTAEVIQNAPAARLRDLYDRFYTPDRALLVVTGDIDAQAIEAKIKGRFADWKGNSAKEGDPVMGTVDPARPIAAAYFQDRNVPTAISIMAITPIDKSADTIEARQRDLVDSIANAVLSRRFTRIARQADAPILSGSASYDAVFSTADMAAINVTAKGDDWRGALSVAEQELRRALLLGVTQAEIDEQLANYRTAFEDAARSADTRRSDALADAIGRAEETDKIVTTPAWRLQFFDDFAPRITPDSVRAALKRIWSAASPLIHVSGKLPIVDPEKAILDAFAASKTIALEAGQQATTAPFAHSDFGAAGRIVADSRIADLDIRTLRFANNVRLNIKKTAFEKDRIRISLRICCGGLEFVDTPGLLSFMGSSFASGGTQAHSLDELQSITAGRSVSLGFSAGPDAFGTMVATTPRDLALQLEILAAYLTAPGFRAEGDMQWQNFIPVYYDTLDASPGGIASRDVGRIIADGDPRFGIPPLETLKARNMAALKTATARAFAHGAIEIGVVGDVDEQAAIDLVAKTFGALPEREADPLPFTAARQVIFARDRKPVTLEHAGKKDEAMVLAYWPTTDDSDEATDAGLGLLAGVMQLMLTEEIRETLGATYSPGASSRTSSLYPGFGQLVTSSNLDPKDIGKVEAAVDEIAAKLRETPVTEDLIRRARAPILERIEKSKRENGTWLALADDAQTQPRWLDRFRTARATYEAINAARLQALAQRYLTAEGALKIRIVKATP